MPESNQNTSALTIKFLKEGIVAFYPTRVKELFGMEGLYPQQTSWGGFEDAYDFLGFLFNFTQTDSLEDAAQWINNFEQHQFTSQNVPSGLGELVKVYLDAKDKAEKRKAAKELQQAVEKNKDPVFSKKITDKIYLKAEKIEIPELAEAATEDLQHRVIEAQKNPTAYTEKLTHVIIGQTQVAEPTAKIVATDFTEKLLSNNPALIYTQNPIHVLVALSNPNDPDLIKLIPDEAERWEFCRAAQNLALIQEHDHILAKNLLAKILPEQTLNILYPDTRHVLPLSITGQEQGSHYTVDRQEFINASNQVSPFIEDLKSQGIGELRSRSLKILNTGLSKLPWYSKIKGIFGKVNIPIAGSSVVFESGMLSFFTTKGIPMLASNMASILATPQFSNVAVSSLLNFRMGTFGISRAVLSTGGNMVGQAFGVNLSSFAIRLTTITGEKGLQIALNITTQAAVKTAATTALAAITKVGAGIAAKVGLGATLSATLGTIVPVVGHAIGLILGWLGGKVLGALVKYIKKNKDFFKYLGLGLLAAGGLFGLWPVAVLGGLMFLGALGLSGLGAIGTSLVATGTIILKFIGTTVVATMALPVVIALCVFPIIVVLILFIINSGVYLVPPKLSTLSGGGLIVSPYIDITKSAKPAGPFANGDLPITVEYTITVHAKKGALTNIKFAYECRVTKKGSSPGCPATTPAMPTGIEIPDSISPTEDFTFNYQQTYTQPDFTDTLVSDIITITADTPEQAGAKAATSLGIKIGNPPDECPNGWPIGGEYIITQTPHGGFSHAVIEAMDIGTPTGVGVRAAHSGTASVVYTTNAYRPLYVDISSTCGGVAFISRYAHLSSVSIRDGQKVTMDQIIGATGSDGTGPHLHYEFMGLKMVPPYIPRLLINGCSDDLGACGKIP